MQPVVSQYPKMLAQLWKILCYFGFIYSVVIFSDDYLERNEVSNSEVPDGVPFPSVSFCLQNPSLLKPDTKFFYTILSSCVNERGPKCFDQLTKLTSDEVLNGTYELSELFLDRIVHEKKVLTKYVEQSYINRFFKCSMYTFDDNLDPFSGVTFDIKNEAVSGQLLVHLTTRTAYPRGMHMPFFYVQDFLSGHYDWKYRHIIQVKMKAPYPDNCFDYKEKDLDNQDHCLERCIYEANDKVMPYVFGAIRGDNYKFGNMTTLYNDNCFRECSRRSCIDDILIVDNARMVPSNLSTSISLRTSEKVVFVKYEPHIAFDKYVIYIGSLLNTWFGFYMYNLDSETYRFLRKQGRNFLKWRTKIVVSLFLCLCCCAGCTLQVSLSAITYFRYEVQSEVYIGPPVPSRLRMPSMSICFDIMDVLNLKKLREKSLCPSHDSNTGLEYRIQCRNQLYGRKFQEIDYVTFQASDLIHEMFLWLPTNEASISSENISSTSYAIGTYFKGRSKCLKIDITRIFKELEPDYQRLMQLSGTILLHLWLEELALTDPSVTVSIYLHNEDTLPFGLAHSVFVTRLNEYELMLYAYNSFKLMEAPYSSKCFDYTADKSKKLSSKQDCIEKCTLELSGFQTSQAVVSEGMLKHYYFDDYEVSQLIVKKCQRLCSRPDCFSIDYRVTSQMKSFLSNRSSFVLSFSALIVDMSLSPDMKLLELVLYVASVSALYFNFNLLIMSKKLFKKMSISKSTASWHPSRRAGRKFILVLLSFGFALHSFLTLVMYFERSTITDGAITDAKKVKMPGLTMCFHFGVTLNESYLTPACLAMELGNYCPEELFKYSPSEMTEISKNLSQLIDKIEFRETDGKSWQGFTGPSLAECEDAKIEITYFFSYKCFTVRLDREYDSKKLEYNPEPLEVARISSADNVSIVFFVHSLDDHLRQDYLSTMTLLTHNRRRKVAYMPKTRKLLPPPYEPTCTGYSHSAFSSQDGCLHNCRQSMLKKYFNYSASNLLRFSDDTFKPAKRSTHSETSKYCKNQCLHPACESSFMNVVRLRSESFNSFMVTVIALRYRVHAEYYPRMQVLDLVIYIGGLSGLWFGIAFVSILKTPFKSRFMKRHLERFKTYPFRTMRRIKPVMAPRVALRTEHVSYIGDHRIIRRSFAVQNQVKPRNPK
ncbi:hypothetical protein HDE_01739 [Halotydeus destructor]|nr:hypothetical protein HDE_01739 [Halotydeus destructor]